MRGTRKNYATIAVRLDGGKMTNMIKTVGEAGMVHDKKGAVTVRARAERGGGCDE